MIRHPTKPPSLGALIKGPPDCLSSTFQSGKVLKKRLASPGYAAFCRAMLVEPGVCPRRCFDEGLGSEMKIRARIRERKFGRPLAITAAVAAISTGVFLMVEFGPGKESQAPNREATRAAAHAAGAKISPTQPGLAVEPIPPGPKRIQPPVPAATY